MKIVAVEGDLPGLPFTPLAALSQYLLLGSLHLSDLKNLEYSKIQSLDLFFFLFSLTYLVPSSSLIVLNTIQYILYLACISPLNSRLQVSSCLLNISTYMANRHLKFNVQNKLLISSCCLVSLLLFPKCSGQTLSSLMMLSHTPDLIGHLNLQHMSRM